MPAGSPQSKMIQKGNCIAAIADGMTARKIGAEQRDKSVCRDALKGQQQSSLPVPYAQQSCMHAPQRILVHCRDLKLTLCLPLCVLSHPHRPLKPEHTAFESQISPVIKNADLVSARASVKGPRSEATAQTATQEKEVSALSPKRELPLLRWVGCFPPKWGKCKGAVSLKDASQEEMPL